MVRALTVLLVMLAACGGIPEEPIPDPITEGCAPGTRPLDDGTCLPAGVTECAEGFVHDGEDGCRAVLPAESCAAGQMAVPGESTCRPVLACPEGTWGGIPVEESTQFVDASFVGTSVGSDTQPWTRVQDAVDAAEPGAIVAIAEGTYDENVIVQGKAVRLIGRCPERVAIRSAAGQPAVLVRTGATGTELNAMAITGAYGVVVSGSQDVKLTSLWIHDTTSSGVDVQNALGDTSLSLSASLVEINGLYGVFVDGAVADIADSLVRDARTDAMHDGGWCVDSQFGARVAVSGSLIERCDNAGVVTSGAEVTLERTNVRDIFDASSAFGLAGPAVYVDYETARASATLRDTVIERSRSAAIVVSGSDATLERVTVRDIAPRSTDGTLGRVIAVQRDDEVAARASLTLLSSSIARGVETGISLLGVDARVESTVVRDIAPLADGRWGRGIDVQSFVEPSDTTIAWSRIERTHEFGILALNSVVTVEATFVSDTHANAIIGEGDGMAVMSDAFDSRLRIDGSHIDRSARAGVANFGAVVSMGSTALDCNTIHLNSEELGGRSASFDDRGANTCKCGAVTEPCQALSSGLEPPAALP